VRCVEVLEVLQVLEVLEEGMLRSLGRINETSEYFYHFSGTAENAPLTTSWATNQALQNKVWLTRHRC